MLQFNIIYTYIIVTFQDDENANLGISSYLNRGKNHIPVYFNFVLFAEISKQMVIIIL